MCRHVSCSQRSVATLEHQIRFDDPGFLIELVNLLAIMHRDASFDIRNILWRHCMLSTRYLLGAQHPLTQISRLLLNMDGGSSEIHNQLMKCEIKVLENRAGLLHPAMMYRRQHLSHFATHK